MNHIYEKLFRYSPHFIFIKSATTLEYVEVNNAFCEYFDISKTRLFDEKEKNQYLQSLEFVVDMIVDDLIISRGMVEIESKLDLSIGQRVCLLRSFPIMNTNSQITHFGFIGQDITEREQYTKILKEKEELWSFALDAAGHGVWDWRIDTGKVVYSKNWGSMLGYDEDEILNSYTEFSSRIYPNDEPRVLDTLNKFIKAEIQTYEIEFRMACKDGSWKWVLSKGIITERDRSSNPIRIVGTHIDINSKKKAEIGEAWRNHVLQLLLSNSDLNEVLYEVVKGVQEEATGAICSIMLLDETKNVLKNAVAPDLPDFYKDKIDNLAIGPDVGCCGAAVYQNKVIIAEDLLTHPNWQSFSGLIHQVSLKSCWSSPIVNSQGVVLGSFAIYHRTQKAPSKQDLKLLEQSAKFTGLAIERKRAAETISHQANFDALTNLPNRRMFMDYLGFEIRKNHRKSKVLALLFLDLDHFKEVNDTLGHHVGDDLLKEVSKRLSKTVRDSDFIARLGGDEFTIVLTDIDSTHQIKTIAEKIIRSISERFIINKDVIYISVSIGITLFPEDASSMNMLLVNADQAMYEAKKKGRNCYQFFSPVMHEESINKQKLAKQLRQALINNEFRLYYQPIIDFSNGKMCKAEALIRWHSTEGVVGPDEFIGISEEIGLIHDIGGWVLKEAFRWKKECNQKYDFNFKITVNMSPAQFKKPKNTHELADLINENNVNGDDIIIEITEGLILDNDNIIKSQLDKFHHCGFQIAIDDFGTGYSALSYLKQFDIDYLKIDRAFVKDIANDNNDLALCMAILVMAKELGIEVVAEGIETKEQRDLLKTAGCKYGQGYLFSKPLESETFEQIFLEPYRK